MEKQNFGGNIDWISQGPKEDLGQEQLEMPFEFCRLLNFPRLDQMITVLMGRLQTDNIKSFKLVGIKSAYVSLH